MLTRRLNKLGQSVLLAASLITAPIIFSAPAKAAGDLLVAPTRIVLDGKRGAEVILNNIGSEVATYRISLELRRMNDVGHLDDIAVDQANETEKAALGMISFAPRRVTLPPNQPQSVRIGLRGLESLPDGEYRAHMLFRAIPSTPSATAPQNDTTELKIQIIPIYGVTIPVIVRKGKLSVTAALTNPKITRDNEGPTLQFDLSRVGDRSVYGEVRVSKPGLANPLVIAKGIAIYPELKSRIVSLPLSPEEATKLKGEVTIGYYESSDAGGALIAQVRTILQ
jgi:P pilus assembly chaperone PapD